MPPTQRTAFLSTPSLFYSIGRDARESAGHALFDIDERYASTPGFTRFDFEDVGALPSALHHSFDAVVIDPPFITPAVWRAYAAAAALLLRPDRPPRVIATSIRENEGLLAELFGPLLRRVAFMPSVPTLVYQYDVFTTFDAPSFDAPNEELGGDGSAVAR